MKRAHNGNDDDDALGPASPRESKPVPKSPRSQPEEYEDAGASRRASSVDGHQAEDEVESNLVDEISAKLASSPEFVRQISDGLGKAAGKVGAGAAAVKGSVKRQVGAVRGAVERGVQQQKQDFRALMAQIPKSEGWMELFLSPVEKANFGRWVEEVSDKSMNHQMTNNAFDKLASFIPSSVGPNMVTLCGLMALAYAYYLTRIYGKEYPTPATYAALTAIVFFYVTNSTDSKHARNTRQDGGFNNFFKYSCDCASTVFLTMLTTWCLGVTEWNTQWYSVQSAQLILFTKHLSAFNRAAGLRYSFLSGPGEVISVVIVILALRATFGLDWLISGYQMTFHQLVKCGRLIGIAIPSTGGDPMRLGAEMMRTAYYATYTNAVLRCLMLPAKHSWSRFGMTASLLMRLAPAVSSAYLGFDIATSHAVGGDISVICDGLFMSILVADVALAKMARREIHGLVVIMSLASATSYPVILLLVAVYYMAVFGDLCHYLNTPLLTPCRNVYCDGVYDLCHVGHKNLFKRALLNGNRLFVGVCNDEACSAYKRPPIMSHDERCAEVEACKAVTKVIPNAPCDGLTLDFILKHQIHVVCFGQEYLDRWPNPNDDLYYKVPRLMGIAVPMPRTAGLSTSDLIKRIQSAQPAEIKKSPT